jgi:hypothetical protein
MRVRRADTAAHTADLSFAQGRGPNPANKATDVVSIEQDPLQ